MFRMMKWTVLFTIAVTSQLALANHSTGENQIYYASTLDWYSPGHKPGPVDLTAPLGEPDGHSLSTGRHVRWVCQFGIFCSWRGNRGYIQVSFEPGEGVMTSGDARPDLQIHEIRDYVRNIGGIPADGVLRGDWNYDALTGWYSERFRTWLSEDGVNWVYINDLSKLNSSYGVFDIDAHPDIIPGVEYKHVRIRMRPSSCIVVQDCGLTGAFKLGPDIDAVASYRYLHQADPADTTSLAYADEVVADGTVGTQVAHSFDRTHGDVNDALGQPDNRAMNLGAQGRVKLKFTDNLLVANEDTSADLYISELGEMYENFIVYVAEEDSPDLSDWVYLGSAFDQSNHPGEYFFDLNSAGVAAGSHFQYVWIWDAGLGVVSGIDANAPGADIDAVFALSSVELTDCIQARAIIEALTPLIADNPGPSGSNGQSISKGFEQLVAEFDDAGDTDGDYTDALDKLDNLRNKIERQIKDAAAQAELLALLADFEQVLLELQASADNGEPELCPAG